MSRSAAFFHGKSATSCARSARSPGSRLATAAPTVSTKSAGNLLADAVVAAGFSDERRALPTKKEAQSVRWVGGDSQISEWEPPTRTGLQPFLTLNFCIAL